MNGSAMTMMRGDTYRSTYVNIPPNNSSVPQHLSRQHKTVHFNATSGSLSRQRESVCQSRGLLNAPGENNCFLNSAVQIFWHLDVFRRNFRKLETHVCLGSSCIFCGIKMLFRQFQESVDTALAPDMLRRALASAFEDQQQFQLGTMHDAAECFENILLRIHYHVQGTSEVANCNDALCIPHRKFSMNLIETFTCNDCNHASEPLIFSQMVHYVAVKALHEKAVEMVQRGVKSLTGLFGKLIRKANESGDQRFCRHCNSPNASLKRTLTNQPDIVTIGLAWESEKSKTQTISDVLHTIDTNICLCHLYQNVTDTEWASSAIHHLVGMICFYGKHYSAFFYHSRYQTWMYFDDASVKEIGPHWSQVVTKCVKGHIQPLLLFYANPEFTPLGEEDASRTSSATSEKMLRQSHSVNSCLGNLITKPQPPRPPARVSSRVTPSNHRDLFSSSSSLKDTRADRRLVLPAGGHSESTLQPVSSSRNSTLRESITSTGSSFPSNETRVFPASAQPEISPQRKSPRGNITSTASYFPSNETRISPAAALPVISVQRKSPRSSITSSSIASLESFDSFDQFRAYAQPVTFDDARDETDSGCPSGDQGSSSSSMEIPVVRREALPKPVALNKTHYIQMLLRADDLVSSGSLKDDKGDFDGAMKLFEQAAGLLQSCVDPLRGCPQLYQALQVKQTDCCKTLRILREKVAIAVQSTTSDWRQPVWATLTEFAERKDASARTLPRKFRMESSDERIPLENENQKDGSLRKMHRSRRKAAVRNMGSRESNRSMPDLTHSDEQENICGRPQILLPNANGLQTFQAPYSPEDGSQRSAQSILLSDILHQRLLRTRLNRTNRDVNQKDDFSDLPPPPPELLASSPSPEPLPEIPADLGIGAGNVHKIYPCSLCGRKSVDKEKSYCLDCHVYMSRFSGNR